MPGIISTIPCKKYKNLCENSQALSQILKPTSGIGNSGFLKANRNFGLLKKGLEIRPDYASINCKKNLKKKLSCI